MSSLELQTTTPSHPCQISNQWYDYFEVFRGFLHCQNEFTLTTPVPLFFANANQTGNWYCKKMKTECCYRRGLSHFHNFFMLYKSWFHSHNQCVHSFLWHKSILFMTIHILTGTSSDKTPTHNGVRTNLWQ